jgi:hypothetical protein
VHSHGGVSLVTWVAPLYADKLKIFARETFCHKNDKKLKAEIPYGIPPNAKATFTKFYLIFIIYHSAKTLLLFE